MMYIFPYKPGSSSAKLLATALNIPRIKHEGSRFRGSANKTVINWGASQVPAEVTLSHQINHSEQVQTAQNKLRFFEILQEAKVRIPPFTSDKAVAEGWIEKGHTVVCRRLLNSSGGKGIVIARNSQELVDAPLYTRYVKKKDEYRIHLNKIGGTTTIFDQQRKAKRNDSDNNQFIIRNLDNGFVFVRQDVRPPRDVLTQATAAFEASSLHFGAVDIIWNSQNEKAYVLEINTAPGLEGQTLQNYANIFRTLQ